MKDRSFKKFKKQDKAKYQRGFVALFSVLIASIILTMALGIANVSLKQIILSGSVSDATRSFYAADSGIECVLYHDLAVPSTFISEGSIDCAGGSWSLDNSIPGISGFSINFSNASGDSCAEVVVDKSQLPLTRVISRGTNVACGVASNRVVERAIQITYY